MEIRTTRDYEQENHLDGAPNGNPRPQPERFPVKHKRQHDGCWDAYDVKRPQVCDSADALPTNAADDAGQHSIQAVEEELPCDERGFGKFGKGESSPLLERKTEGVIATSPLCSGSGYTIRARGPSLISR